MGCVLHTSLRRARHAHGDGFTDQKFEWRCRDLVGRGWYFACPDIDPFSVRCQNREGHSPLAIHSAVCVHALVLLAAGSVLCYGESINLTCDMSNGRLNEHSERRGRNIQICWRADLTGFGSVKFKETQRRACTYYPAHLPYLNSILGSLQGQGGLR